MSRRLALLSMVLWAAGCSGGLHSDGPPMQIYLLRAAPAPPLASEASGDAVVRPLDRSTANAPAAGVPSAPTLQVARPSADPGLSTELITLVRSDHRLDYYSGSRWAAELPDVVSTLALDTLRASGDWGAVHDSPGTFSSDYILQITIRRFEADYTDGKPAPKVHVMLDCTLARRVGRELVTSFSVQSVADAGENRLGTVVAAFEKAANTALGEMAARSATAVRNAPVTAAQ